MDNKAQVMKLVNMHDSESCAEKLGGSSPLLGTKTLEALIITAEECAEVIQQISKIIRFGLDTPYITAADGTTNREQLEKEIGDLRCMIDLLQQMHIIDNVHITQAQMAKREKLRKWSSLID